MRKGILVLVAAFACAGLVAGTAVAAKRKIDTDVTLTNPSPGVYTGKVKAARGCDAARLVAVWHDTNGNGKIDPPAFEGDLNADFKIGEEISDKDGKYTVKGNQAPKDDNIIAEVAKSERRKKICKEGRVVAKARG